MLVMGMEREICCKFLVVEVFVMMRCVECKWEAMRMSFLIGGSATFTRGFLYIILSICIIVFMFMVVVLVCWSVLINVIKNMCL